jgi:hypothetical protein
MLLRSTGLHGVFVGAHAVAEGWLTRRQLREGPYVRVLHGVYADPSLRRDHVLRCRAASLLMPGGAALGGRSAAAPLGAPEPSHGDPVTVVIPPPLEWAGPKGVRVHRTELGDREIRGPALDGRRVQADRGGVGRRPTVRLTEASRRFPRKWPSAPR